MPPADLRKPSVWQELARSPALTLWVLFILLTPLHVVGSGLPQPGDWLVLILVPATFAGWRGKLDRDTVRMVRPLLWFTVWVFVVNYAWALILGRFDSPKDFLIHPFFYMFNAGVFVCALIQARMHRDVFLRVTVDAVFATVVILAVTSFAQGESYYRGQLFFNSPNQLGYYALLAACLFAMAQRPLGMTRTKPAIGITCCAYLALISASRASVAGILILLVVLLFSSPRMIIIACLAAIALVSIGGPINHALEVSQTRVERGNTHGMSFTEERGYDRVISHPEFLMTGAGEGGYERFVPEGQARRELHSSFGTIVFGYGIVGIGLFLVFFGRVVQRAPWRMALILIPSLVFTVAHQGLRSTMFWVVIAVFAILKTVPEKKPQKQQKQHGAHVLAHR